MERPSRPIAVNIGLSEIRGELTGVTMVFSNFVLTEKALLPSLVPVKSTLILCGPISDLIS